MFPRLFNFRLASSRAQRLVASLCRVEGPDSATESKRFAAAFAAAGAVGASTLLALQPPTRCFYDKGPDGGVNRLKRWSSRSWNVKSGSSPGFHLRSVNPVLEKYLTRLAAECSRSEGPPPSVLVPLCGKSVDMLYLCEQGFRVVGVEGVSRPILEFKSEQRMRLKDFRDRTVLSFGGGGWSEGASFESAEAFQGGRLGKVFKMGTQGLGYYTDFPAVWRGKVRAGNRTTLPLHVLQADMFDVTPDLVSAATFEERGMFDMIYDRAALDAVYPAERHEYVANASKLLTPGGRLLLSVADYDQAQVPIDHTGRRWSPPPFSIPESEVRSLFPAGQWEVEVLDRKVDADLSAGNPAFHGVVVHEAAYLITKKGASSDSRRKYTGGLGLALAIAGVAGAACRFWA